MSLTDDPLEMADKVRQLERERDIAIEQTRYLIKDQEVGHRRVEELEDGVELLIEEIPEDALAKVSGSESLGEFLCRLLDHNPVTCVDSSCGFCFAHGKRVSDKE